MHRRLSLIIGILCILGIAFYSSQAKAGSIEDENIIMTIEVNGIDPWGSVQSSIYCEVGEKLNFDLFFEITGSLPVIIDKIRFILDSLNLAVFAYDFDEVLPPGTKGILSASIDLNEYLPPRDPETRADNWNLRLEIVYVAEGKITKLKSTVFEVTLGEEPSSFGIVEGAVVASTAVAGVSAASLVLSVNAIAALEITKSVAESTVLPIAELADPQAMISTIKEIQQKVADTCQKEAHKFTFVRCPSCHGKWSGKVPNCPKCNVSIEEAKEIYSKKTQEKCIKACSELSRSISGMRVVKLASTLGVGVVSTSGIIKIVTKSGLAYVKPYTGKTWSGLKKKIVFTGLSSGISAIFWFQKLGYTVASVSLFIGTVIFGLCLPIIIRRLLNNRIKRGIEKFWKKESEMIMEEMHSDSMTNENVTVNTKVS